MIVDDVVIPEDGYTIEDGKLIIYPEAWANFEDGEYTMRTSYADGTEDSYTVVVEDGVPTGILQHDVGEWSSFNLIALLVAICLMFAHVVEYRRLKKGNDEDECDETQRNKKRKERRILNIAILLAPICNLLLFMFTQDMTLTVAFFDNWSILFLSVLAIQAACATLIHKKKAQQVEALAE